MFSGIPMDGSDTPLQSGIVEFNPDSMKTITPPGGSSDPSNGSSGSGIDRNDLFPGASINDPIDAPIENLNPTPEGQDGAGGTKEPDPEQPGGDPGDGEELELVKEKTGKQQNDRRRKIVRLALLAVAVFIAYRLFFKRR